MTNHRKYDIISIEIKKGGRKTMKEIKVMKTMYETIDKKVFNTKEEAEQHESNLNYHKELISYATHIRNMCEKYYDCETDSCNDMCPFKVHKTNCAIDDYPINWIF